MSKTFFEHMPGYTRIGFKSLETAEKYFPIGTVFVQYVPFELQEQINVVRDFLEDSFFIPKKYWKYKMIKPGETFGQVAEIKTLGKIGGYYFDGKAYWPMKGEEYDNTSVSFVYIPEKEIEKYV